MNMKEFMGQKLKRLSRKGKKLVVAALKKKF
jgi:hypothetical protein